VAGAPALWLFAGPPFAGTQYREVVTRLRELRPTGRVECVAVSEAGAGWEDSAASLAVRVAEGDILFAHGLAVPVACGVAAARGLGALVLSNGPLRALDPVSSAVVALARAPGFGALAFRRRPWLTWLASSGGLRRAVNNPYAMDRDTVATVCGPLVHSGEASGALRRWLSSLDRGWPDPAQLEVPLRLLWGDNDRLHPLSEADRVDAIRGGGCIVVQPGGRFAWPEEMPWALADHLLAAWGGGPDSATAAAAGGRGGPSGRATTTSTSRLAQQWSGSVGA
jgi:hypothetical protein